MRAVVLLAVVGCGHAAVAPVERTPLPPELAAPRGMLVLGDLHGTQEIPRFVGGVVATLAERAPVVLALEIPEARSPGVPAYLASDGGPAAREALLRGAFWQDPYQDGRRSVAMLALIDTARQLRAAGKRIDLDLFDADLADPTQETREEAMARHLVATRAARPDAALVVYVGNLHAVRTEHEALPGFTWLAGRLARAGLDFKVLGPRWQRGTAWTCHGNDPAECGEGPVGGDGGPPGITLGTTPGGHYDGWFDVGPVTASPPAGRQPRLAANGGPTPPRRTSRARRRGWR
jgi:hypothetical protein